MNTHQEIENEIKQLLIDLPRRAQYEVLCIITFMRLRSNLRLLNSLANKDSRLNLVMMAIRGAWDYYTLKLRVALTS